ncbi:MAG TPA: type II toxin-antitoxin system VapB family antitoxin [Longimicrobiales bacterium]|nr:type II toxin-antitoxin system VapB family antitoxin [Longimicrobiales bacterium]
MALNIKNQQVERLASEIAELTGESKTEAIRQSLLERRDRLRYRFAEGDRKERIMRFLEREVWPRVPKDQLGKGISKKEREAILGYGPDGV